MNYRNVNCSDELPLLSPTSEDKDLQTSPCPNSIYYIISHSDCSKAPQSLPHVYFFFFLECKIIWKVYQIAKMSRPYKIAAIASMKEYQNNYY